MQVEGSGNGIKTKIPNLSDIAKDLHREAADILKMFGFELGAVTIARDDVNSYIVNGKFSANELADVLDSFVEKFVLCGSCRNPGEQCGPLEERRSGLTQTRFRDLHRALQGPGEAALHLVRQ